MKCTRVPGVSLGVLLLALLKGASSGPVASGRALATLTLEASPGLSYSRRVTLAVRQWAEKSGKCDGSSEIWYKNECNELASHYTPSCSAKQWLVLEKPKKSDQGTAFPVKPKCVDMPCEFPKVWWGPLRKCVDVQDVEEVCGERNIFRTDPFGDVHCDCSPAQGQLTEGANCHEYYQQGPCKNNQVLVKDLVSSVVKCVPDCLKELQADDEEKARAKRAGKPKARTSKRGAQSHKTTSKASAPVTDTETCVNLSSVDNCDALKILNDKYVLYLVDAFGERLLCTTSILAEDHPKLSTKLK